MTRHLSHSQVSSWLRCPRAYQHRYLLNTPQERSSIHLLFGSSVHDAIAAEAQRRMDGDEGGLEYAQDAFKEMMVAKAIITDADIDLAKKTFNEWLELGKGLIDAYFEHGVVDHVVELEREFNLILPDGTPLNGFLDFVVDKGDGLEVVELKTAARSYSDMQVRLAEQATAYAWSLGADQREVKVTYIVLVKTKVPKVQVIETVRGPKDVKRFQDLALSVGKGISSGCFPRNQSVQNCSKCEFRDGCLGQVA
jgi:putative RecB family exonuclease